VEGWVEEAQGLCHNGRAGTVEFFKARLDEEVYEGAGQSLRQFIYTRVAEKLASNDTDEAFEMRLRREYEELVQFGKKNVCFPTSLYLMRNILGVRGTWELEYHICPCQCHFWHPMHRSQWRLAPEECTDPELVCPFCSGPRFLSRTETGGRQVLVPVSVRRIVSGIAARILMLGKPRYN